MIDAVVTNHLKVLVGDMDNELFTINEQIPKSAQTPLFTLREHFEQKSLVKHNF